MEHNNSATRGIKLALPEMLAQKDDHLYIWALIPSDGGGEKPRKFHVMLNGRGNALLVRVPVPAYLAVDRRLTLTRVEIYRACSLSRTDGEAYTGAIPWGWTGSWVVKPHLFEIKPPMAGAWRFKLSRDALAAYQAEGEQGMVPPPPPALSINDNSSDANLSTASSAHEHLRQEWFKTFVSTEKSEPNDDRNSEVSSSSADDADDEDDGPSLLKRIREWDEFSSDAPMMRSSARPKRSASAPPELQH